MELDSNVAVHNLLWWRTWLRTKKAYRESFGVARKELLEPEMQRLIDAGDATKSETCKRLQSVTKAALGVLKSLSLF